MAGVVKDYVIEEMETEFQKLRMAESYNNVEGNAEKEPKLGEVSQKIVLYERENIYVEMKANKNIKQENQSTRISKTKGSVTDKQIRRPSTVNFYDVTPDVHVDSDEDSKDADYATEKFSEASIRLEEKFECGFCSSPSVIGRCDQCIEYLCQKCVNRHDRLTVSGTHDVFYFRCAESMKANKIVPATGFCQVCQVYLCAKCVIYHQGFKKFRNHFIVTGTEMPVIRPKRSPVKHRQKSRNKTDSNLSRMKQPLSRLSYFRLTHPLHQTEPKLTWSEKRGHFFKWFQY